MAETVRLRVNGVEREIAADPATPLLERAARALWA